MKSATVCPQCQRPFTEIGPAGAHCGTCDTTFPRQAVTHISTNGQQPHVPILWPRTDTGNAELFVALFGDHLRYDHRRGRWLVWAGHWWQPDDDGEVTRLAIKAARRRYQAAVDIPDQHERAREALFAIASENRPKIDAMLAIARALHPVSDTGEGWDTDPWLFAASNGIIDLRTCELRDGRPEDRISKHAPTTYDRAAVAPSFDRFLEEILPDRDVRDYIQRLAGYILTGTTHEQMLGFWHGGGANGKSTLADVIMYVMGPDYARTAAPGLLLKTKYDRHPTELADLFGARLVVSVEVEEGRALAEALVKWLTGGDRVKARYMNHDFFEFDQTAKILLLANHQPTVRGRDLAIWRRVKLVPFDVTITRERQDPDLPTKLRDEASGILNWMIAGCFAWQHTRLAEPDAVRNATERYRVDSDNLAPFLEECCDVRPTARVHATALYRSYRQWAKASAGLPDHDTLSQTAFSRRISSDPRFDRGHTRTGWLYQGIGLTAEPTLTDE